MTFQAHLSDHLRRHPSMQPQDVVKLCYQAARGAEHLLSDPAAAERYLQEEYKKTPAEDGPLLEPLSDHVCRINLAAYKGLGLPIEWLFRAFLASSGIESGEKERFSEYLREAEEVFRSENVRFTLQEWSKYLEEYRRIGMPPVHHSEEYRRCERPAYRIVSSRFARLLPLLSAICKIPPCKHPLIIAIDGRAASGKSTLADFLETVLSADIIHMDDFFVPPALRSEERFRTPGENIHHERFREEVLPYLREPDGFSYRIFDCGRMDYHGERRIGDKPYRIVEGSYSTHPIFGRYADITVFSEVSADEQTARIRRRNGERMLGMFLDRWVPMEEAYFTHYAIREKADMIL